jgi:diguanylate cyclase (GGDEF)-like protein
MVETKIQSSTARPSLKHNLRFLQYEPATYKYGPWNLAYSKTFRPARYSRYRAKPGYETIGKMPPPKTLLSFPNVAPVGSAGITSKTPASGHFIKSVLVVEDSQAIAHVVSKNIIANTGHPTSVVHSYQEAYKLLHEGQVDFLASVVDLTLPDAPNGEVADLTIDAGIPTIVLTGQYSDEARSRILSKDVVDYFMKTPGSLQLVDETILRLEKNLDTKILVAASSAIFRNVVRRLLRTHCFQILEAKDDGSALRIQEDEPDLVLAVVGNSEGSSEGIDLVNKLREKRSSDELAIIGISGSESSSISVRFIKFGADDFLKRPFEKEEFYCRIYRSIKTLESIRKIKKEAFTDALTGLANRLYFFQNAYQVLEKAKVDGLPFTVAMIDIDFFKQINDTYGHLGGDVALIQTAYLLRDKLGEADIISRFGGEEFCVLLSGKSSQEAVELFEGVREAFESKVIHFNTYNLKFTISIGVCTAFELSLEAAVKRADDLLYKAKNLGRNQVASATGLSVSLAPRHT